MSKTVMTIDDSAGIRQMVRLTLQNAEHAGATGGIIKPFKPEQLLDVTRKLLR